MRAFLARRGRDSAGSRFNSGHRIARWLLASLLLLTIVPAASANETLTYTYDALGRLVKVARAGTVNNTASECYAYDPASNRSNVTVSTTGGCNAPSSASFSINNASATEGSVVNFTVTRSGSTTGTDSVQYATGTTGTATSGVDYTAISPPQTLTFNPGVTTRTVSISTIQDTLVEGNETFNVNLSNPSAGATISDSQGVGTVVDDDSATGTLTLTPATLPAAKVGSLYDQQIFASGGTGSYTFSATGLPAWLSLTSQGVLSGTPTAAGTTPSFTVNASDGASGAGSKAYTITINPGLIANSWSQTLGPCGTANVDVVAQLHDSDPDGDAITVSGVTNVTKGVAQFSGTVVTYTASVGTGTGTLTYTISDGKGETGSNTMTFTMSGGVCP